MARQVRVYHPQHRNRNDFNILGIPSSPREIQDILKAWVVISFIFAILRARSYAGSSLFSLIFTTGFLREMMLAGITVGIGFFLHELAHKIVAQHYGCVAEFRSDDMMLLMALGMSIFLGFVFVAPGATVIGGNVKREHIGWIAIAGPWINIAIAGFFILLWDIGYGVFAEVGMVGFQINSFLALFNMIPFFILDGKKVWDWNKGIWGATTAVAAVLVFISFQIGA